MTREELKGIVFKTHSPLTVEEVMFGIDKYVEQKRAEVIEFVTDEIIYPLLDEYDRGLWEHISYIELAGEWIKALDDNSYPKVKNNKEAIKKELGQWIAEKLKEQNK